MPESKKEDEWGGVEVGSLGPLIMLLTMCEPISLTETTIRYMYFTANHYVFFQDRGNVYLLSLGTIHNCLRHPDVIPIVKQMDIVPHVAPFLDKRSPSKCKDS